MYLVKSLNAYFGTNAERVAAGLSSFLAGDEFNETDTGNVYQHNGMAWIKTAVDGSGYLPLSGGTLTGGLVVNSSEGDNDFRIAGNGVTNGVYFDAGNSRLGLGTNVPDAIIDVYKDHNGLTDYRVYNPNSGSSAVARAFLRAETAQLFSFAASDAWNAVAEFTGKSGIYTGATGGNLVLAARVSTGGIDFYAGGSAAGNKRMTLSSAGILELIATTGALLLPRLTTTQQNALTAVNGMLIYNTSTNKFRGYAGGAWVDLH